MKSQLSMALVAATLIFGAADGYAQKTKKPKKGAVADTLSYAYGMMMGKEFKNAFSQQGLAINKEEFLKAMSDAMGDDEKALKLTEEAAIAFLDAYGRKMQEEEMKRMEKESVDKKKAEDEWFAKNVDTKPGIQKTASGLRYEVLKAGTGAKPTAQSYVTTHYHGTLTDGTVFDSSVERGEPATFPVGGVIPGWVEILQLMPAGSKWRVYIPFNLGYGDRGAGESIPPFTTLIFEIELISIQ